jgi:hypothetical protein
LRSIASPTTFGRRGGAKCCRSRFRQTQVGCYHGLEVLGGGSVLTDLVLGAIGVFVKPPTSVMKSRRS